MTRMTGPDCVVMCNLINTYIHTYIHTYYIYLYTYIYIPFEGVGKDRRIKMGPWWYLKRATPVTRTIPCEDSWGCAGGHSAAKVQAGLATFNLLSVRTNFAIYIYLVVRVTTYTCY